MENFSNFFLNKPSSIASYRICLKFKHGIQIEIPYRPVRNITEKNLQKFTPELLKNAFILCSSIPFCQIIVGWINNTS